MSATHEIKQPEPEQLNLTRTGVLPVVLLVAGLFLLIISGVWAFFDKKSFAYSWLLGFMFVFTISAGCLFWVLLHHAVDADWSVGVRRILETGASLFLPWLPLLFIPILFCMPELYKWWTTDPAKDPLLVEKQWWLANDAFFWARQVVYFGVFAFFAWWMRGHSVAQDTDGRVSHSLTMRKWSYAGIPLFAFSLTFFAIDWLMALDFHWFSTMWGVYIFAGVASASMAALILVSNALRTGGYLRHVINAEHNHIMGKFLFAFTIFWAYIAFSQYMLIYYANIPEETIFFLNRNEGTWWHLSVFLVFARFFFPFLLLITQPAKRNPKRLCFAAAWIIGMHFIDLYWIILPQLQVNLIYKGLMAQSEMGVAFSPIHILPAVGMSCILGYIFLHRLAKDQLFPSRDPRLYESVTITN